MGYFVKRVMCILTIKSGKFWIRTLNFQKIVFIDFNESSLKMMKTAFYFMLKALFVLEILTFLSWLLGYVGNRPDKKAMFNFKIYNATDWTTNSHKHILFNISRSKGNETMKCGQLIKYNMRNILLEKSYIRCGGETSSGPFYKKSKLSISLNQQSEMLKFVFIVYPGWDLQKYIETKVLTTCFYLISSFFKKTKRDLELVSLPPCLLDNRRKVFLALNFINSLSFVTWLPLFLEILGNIIICQFFVQSVTS